MRLSAPYLVFDKTCIMYRYCRLAAAATADERAGALAAVPGAVAASIAGTTYAADAAANATSAAARRPDMELTRYWRSCKTLFGLTCVCITEPIYCSFFLFCNIARVSPRQVDLMRKNERRQIPSNRWLPAPLADCLSLKSRVSLCVCMCISCMLKVVCSGAPRAPAGGHDMITPPTPAVRAGVGADAGEVRCGCVVGGP